jgi:hypothetical protein
LIARARTVDAILKGIGSFEAIRKADLHHGDRVLVATENSVYSIHVEEDGSYSISGGWFDRNGLSPASTSIAGCTWGGTAIKRDLVAARGLRLEFGNRVVTSTIREVRVIRGGGLGLGRLGPVRTAYLFRACYGADADRS